jgi:energy-coupling factor transporter ATP-binding protein EcfA2
MINFPIFNKLDIEGYGLYPGTKSSPGLHFDFRPGLTLIVGANGLGKTTLITVLYRLLTGPNDIPGLVGRSELGNVDLEIRKIPASDRRIFADRVVGGAKTSTARVSLSIGEHSITIERILGNLELLSFEVDGEQEANDENSFQERISTMVGVWSFSDWILLLRHLVFYFEDRRSLVWDATAQRQLLRFLFLPATTAEKWTQSERAILELDSSVRNRQFSITRQEAELSQTEDRAKSGAEVRQELKALQQLQDADTKKRDSVNDALVSAEARRGSTRLRYIKAEQEREARYRELERSKLTAVEARFPAHSDTARYIVAQLLSEGDCLVCGTHVPKTAAELDRRIKHEQCVICGSDNAPREGHVSDVKVADRRVDKNLAALRKIEPDLAEARESLDAAEREYASLVEDAAKLDADVTKRSQRIDGLVRQLPPEEAELHKQREELSMMRTRLAKMRADLVKLRTAFSKFVEDESRALVNRSGAIKQSFDRYAEGFLLEQCTLIWSPHKARIGQGGELIEFPAFELDMTGTDFPSPVRRSGPEQVSESQREFIDLAFRMSLMEVAGSVGAGSLIIDAPESSLDAVFVSRAANVLARFAKPSKGNRLIITSNLVEGDLIPELLIASSPVKTRLSRLIDLFKVAEPTAAIRELSAEYRAVLSSIVRKVKKPAKKAGRTR